MELQSPGQRAGVAVEHLLGIPEPKWTIQTIGTTAKASKTCVTKRKTTVITKKTLILKQILKNLYLREILPQEAVTFQRIAVALTLVCPPPAQTATLPQATPPSAPDSAHGHLLGTRPVGGPIIRNITFYSACVLQKGLLLCHSHTLTP